MVFNISCNTQAINIKKDYSSALISCFSCFQKTLEDIVSYALLL